MNYQLYFQNKEQIRKRIYFQNYLIFSLRLRNRIKKTTLWEKKTKGTTRVYGIYWDKKHVLYPLSSQWNVYWFFFKWIVGVLDRTVIVRIMKFKTVYKCFVYEDEKNQKIRKIDREECATYHVDRGVTTRWTFRHRLWWTCTKLTRHCRFLPIIVYLISYKYDIPKSWKYLIYTFFRTNEKIRKKKYLGKQDILLK